MAFFPHYSSAALPVAHLSGRHKLPVETQPLFQVGDLLFLRRDLAADHLQRIIHALSPAPGAYGMLEEERFKVLRVRNTGLASSQAGELRLENGRLLMGTATTRMELIDVQPSGKRVMSGHDWAMGRREALGAIT